jgi:hypothetical protein
MLPARSAGDKQVLVGEPYIALLPLNLTYCRAVHAIALPMGAGWQVLACGYSKLCPYACSFHVRPASYYPDGTPPAGFTIPAGYAPAGMAQMRLPNMRACFLLQVLYFDAVLWLAVAMKPSGVLAWLVAKK